MVDKCDKQKELGVWTEEGRGPYQFDFERRIKSSQNAGCPVRFPLPTSCSSRQMPYSPDQGIHLHSLLLTLHSNLLSLELLPVTMIKRFIILKADSCHWNIRSW